MSHSSAGSVPGCTVPTEVIETLESWQRTVVITHVTPDADALGSMCSLAKVFSEGGGRSAKVSLPENSLSQRLAFLYDRARLPVAEPKDFAAADGFVVVDTATKSRCNLRKDLPEDWDAGRPLLNIDHHASNTRFGTINWVVGDAGSSAELIYYLIKSWGRSIDPLVASLLYAGIHTDTAGFSLPNTTKSALAAAAELVGRGADVTDLGERLCRSQRLSEFKLLRTVYANTRLAAGGRIAYSTADHREITEAGCAAADIDDQVSVPRALYGTRLAMLFTEGVRGQTRINFRGDGGLSVLELAQAFSGGGHGSAAGAIVPGTLNEVVPRVLPEAEAYLNRLEQASRSAGGLPALEG
ncbi:MAG: bifunctional oligoribonuclease/PAP phosphatase NrnA [Planctomycetota bacterium]